ncbi:hypothetical protein [Lapidilactobacillus salsurivasis]
MKKTPVYLILLALPLLILLTACQKATDRTADLKNDVQTIQTEIATQRKELKTIYQKYAQLQKVFAKEQKNNPETNLLTDHSTQTYRLNEQARKSLDRLGRSQKQVLKINERVKKVDITRINGLTSAEVTELTQSIHIITLDHENFTNFISAFQKDQTEFYRDVPELFAADKDGLDERQSRSRRYLGAVDQQLEILQVNLNSTEAAAKKILKSIS